MKESAAAACLLALLAASAAADGLPSCKTQPPSTFLPVPLVRQATDYSCGAASLLAILYYWRAYDGFESSLYARLGTTPKDGTRPDKIVAGARSFGLKAAMREGVTVCDLADALSQGQTVIVNFQAWRDSATASIPWDKDWEDGHFAVLVGIKAGRAYFMDPSTGGALAYVPLAELPARWHDYDMIDGKRRDWSRLAIFISGKTHVRTLPAPAVPLE